MAKNRTDRTEQKLEELKAEIADLRAEISVLHAEEGGMVERRELSMKLDGLREEISSMRIDKARLVEENEKDRREVEHMIGLERNRQTIENDAAEAEIAVARREAMLEVREESLGDKEEAFEKQMEFIEVRMAEENKYVRKIMEKILDRLPDVNVAINGRGGVKVEDD